MANIPDVLVAAASVYGLLLENEKVRVMEIKLKPGEKAPMHNHPHAHVVYPKTDATLKLVSPDGKEVVFDLKAGQASWHEAGSHEGVNVGTTNLDNLVFEIKN